MLTKAQNIGNDNLAEVTRFLLPKVSLRTASYKIQGTNREKISFNLKSALHKKAQDDKGISG